MGKSVLAIMLYSLLVVATIKSEAATVIVDKPLDNTAGFGWYSSARGQQIAEDFTVASAIGATEATWYGSFSFGPQTGEFDILFFDDVAGAPSNNDFYSTTTTSLFGVDTGLTEPGGTSIFLWQTSIPIAALTPGTKWISIRGSVGSEAFVWSHSMRNGDGVVASRISPVDDWKLIGIAASRDAQALKLEGVIPVPAAAWLFGSALLGLVAVKRNTA